MDASAPPPTPALPTASCSPSAPPQATPPTFISDRLGSTIGVPSTTGGITRRYTYILDGGTGTGPSIPFRYASGQKIENLTHFAASNFDPTNTQWTQVKSRDQVGDLRQAND